MTIAHPGIDYVGVAKLRRRMTAEDLASLRRPMFVIGPHREEPLAVVITYREWVGIQAAILAGGAHCLEEIFEAMRGYTDTDSPGL